MEFMRIVIGESDTRTRNKLKDILTRQGHLIVGEAKDGNQALLQIRSTEPDLVILESKLPGTDGLEIAKIIEESRIAPVVLLVEPSQQDVLYNLKDSWVFAFLIKPIQELNILPAIKMARSNFEKIVSLEKEITELKESLDQRKIVERAKGLLMSKKGLSEDQAYKYIQQQSMKKRVSKNEIAEAIILMLE